jgi:hypothetical protein
LASEEAFPKVHVLKQYASFIAKVVRHSVSAPKAEQILKSLVQSNEQ